MGTGMRVRLTPQLTRFMDEAVAQGALSQVPPRITRPGR